MKALLRIRLSNKNGEHRYLAIYPHWRPFIIEHYDGESGYMTYAKWL